MKFKAGDKVRVLDGSKIEDYLGGWSALGMERYVGKVGTVKRAEWVGGGEGYYLKDFGGYLYDGRGLERVTKHPRRIIIEEKHGKVTARLGNNKVTTEAESLEDGAKDALGKLLSRREFKVGDVVQGISEGKYCITKKGWVGRVTEICEDDFIEVYGANRVNGYGTYKVEAKDFELKVPMD